MSSLLQQFHDEISLRSYSARTRDAYLRAITQLQHYANQPLDSITDEQLTAYFRYLNLERHHSRATLKLQLNGKRPPKHTFITWPSAGIIVYLT